MMKILITDDEKQIRKGIRMKVDLADEGFYIVDEASNGQEALDRLKKIDIDIVITDVRMPIMDGMEFVKHCHREYPHVKVIVLSGYSDFEYVRTSIVSGVKDYLLKPVDPDELVDALKRIRTEVEKEKKRQREFDQMNQLVNSQLEDIREQYMLHLVKEEWLEHGVVIERLHQLQLEALAKEEVQVQFITVEIREASTKENILKDLWLAFRMLCKEIAYKDEGTFCFYDPNYANMIHFIYRNDSEPLDCSSKFITSLQRHVKEFLKLETVIGIGSSVTGYQEYKTGYISALLSWSQSRLGNQSQVIDGTVNKEMYEFSPDFEKRLINAIENGKFGSLKNDIFSILGGNNNQSIITFSFAANRILFLLGYLGKKYDIDTDDINKMIWTCQQSIWQLNSQTSVMDQLIALGQLIIDRVLKARCSSNGMMIVENVRRYLDQHYASEVSLASLSEQFHINSSYLSDLFKNHVGKNLSDYLLHLRMENAKKFLKDSQLKIIDVAHLVGFSNSGYFGTVFKKYVGKTPVEYRKSLGLVNKY
jgi:two-component system, response regulator YesN